MPSTKPIKEKIAKGVFKDRSGIAIRISVDGKPIDLRREQDVRAVDGTLIKRGQSYKGRDRAWLIKERIRRQAEASLKHQKKKIAGYTLAADAADYLKTLSGRTKDDTENLLSHWLAQFADRPRHEITALDLRQHAATWTIAPSTFNHRRQALISLYKALDGPQAPNPARELPKQRELLGAPKALPYDVIEGVFERMPPSQSRARLKVMAYTGLPQMQISKLTPEDWQGARLRVTPRRKGSGAAGRWLPLSAEAQAAMQEFQDLDCWGTFSRSSLNKAWARYAPAGSNPYSLRHSWLTELYRRSKGDVLAVKNLALHSTLQQTERYAAAALEERMADLVLPRFLTTKPDGNLTKASTKLHRKRSAKKPRSRGK